MSDRFDKDGWIRRALASGALKAFEDGSIYRMVKIEDGRRVYARQAYRIHKKSGRVYFNFTFEGVTKSVLVNRVIGWAFHPNPHDLPQVNHIDGNKENNAAANLEWATRNENERHAFRTGLKTGRGSQNANAKLTAADVLRIRQSSETDREIAKSLGVSPRAIRDVRSGKTWSHI